MSSRKVNESKMDSTRQDLAKQISRIAACYDWDYLSDAYRYCIWVPKQLQRLASLNPADRRNARQHFYEMLFHQQTHYEATGQLCVTLARIACLPHLPDREKTIALIAELMHIDCEDDFIQKPMTIESAPYTWSFHWTVNYEFSFNEFTSAASDLWNLVEAKNEKIRYWAAKLLTHIRDYQPRIPVAKTQRPPFTEEQNQLLTEILAEMKFELPEFDKEDHPLEESEFANIFEQLDCHRFGGNSDEPRDLVRTIGVDFVKRLPEMSERELGVFASRLRWNSTWQDNEEFVSNLLDLIEEDEPSSEGAVLATQLVSVLDSVRVCLRRTADLLLEMALESKDQAIQAIAASSLYKLPWSSRDRIGYLVVVLKDGDFPARTSLLNEVKLGTSNIRWIGRPISNDADDDLDSNQWDIEAQEKLIAAILALLDSHDERIRSDALDALGGLKLDNETEQRMWELVKDPCANVRILLACRLDPQVATEVSQRLLIDPDADVRAAQARRMVFSEFESRNLADSFLNALNDENPLVVAAAAYSAVCYRGPRDSEVIETELRMADLVLDSIDANTPVDNLILQSLLILHLDESKKDALVELLKCRKNEIPYWLGSAVKRYFGVI